MSEEKRNVVIELVSRVKVFEYFFIDVLEDEPPFWENRVKCKEIFLLVIDLPVFVNVDYLAVYSVSVD